MKTLYLTLLVMIVISMMAGCTKNNSNPVTGSSDFVGATDNISAKASIKAFLKPENFVSGVTNQYFPLTPGDTFFYKFVGVEDGDSSFQDIYVTTTNDIKVITGINCTVVHDVVMENGILTEDTYDWYAQDIHGNVWYFGEDTKAYDPDGSYSTEGSFENGVDGAVAGIIMLKHPENFIGMTYRQEHYAGQALDHATVLSTNETVTIAMGTFTNCVMTEETTPLEPGVKENKWYAPGIGQILSIIAIGGK